MPLWIQKNPLAFQRHRTRDLAKVTTLALARYAYTLQAQSGEVAHTHFQTLIQMHLAAINGHHRALTPSDFRSSQAMADSKLTAETRTEVEFSGQTGAELRIARLQTIKKPSSTIDDDLLRHEQIHFDISAIGCIAINRRDMSATQKRDLLPPFGEALRTWTVRHYDDPVGVRPLFRGTDHGRNLSVQREFWNSGAWLPPFLEFLQKELEL